MGTHFLYHFMGLSHLDAYFKASHSCLVCGESSNNPLTDDSLSLISSLNWLILNESKLCPFLIICTIIKK